MKAEIRAGLIAVVLLSQALAAIPNPPKLADNALTDPLARDELEGWVKTVGYVGWNPTPEELLTFAQDWVERLKSWRKAAIAPFQPVLQFTGTGQGWGLFAFPDQRPYRFEIAVLEPTSGWEAIYVDLDPEADYRSELFVNRRVRAIYNPGKAPAPAFQPFTKWLGKQILDEYPDAVAVRFAFRRSEKLVPGEPPPGYDTKLKFIRRYNRGTL
ncbi:MAG: hypothetical protein EP330_07590 [Deltaproteobacteria bacterium]|nr:MAG: hypothetical protein EP330_07590 [Deltaproteobacteria bacterium]